jgi:hypoxanthine phosphoribosyltransferase
MKVAARFQVHPDVEEVLLTSEQIHDRVRELAEEISRDHAGRELLLVAVLRGAAIFAADLIRELKVPAALDFMAISSYAGGTRSTGEVRILKDLDESPEGRHVLVVEDIIDTGLSLRYLTEMLRGRHPARLDVCALLDKPSARRIPAQVRYLGFTVPDAFVVGYGLDYKQRYRGLPYIGTLQPRVYGG